jgi:glycosyltransferase involved in cell wall biosynthesis
MRPKVLLISSVHPATDPRIVYKIGPSLMSQYEVHCILPQASQKMVQDGLRMIPIPAYERLLLRILLVHPIILWKSFRVKPDLIHIFVPELIPIAFILKFLGIKVIYEVQENLYKKLNLKKKNNAWIFQMLFQFFDPLAQRHFNFIFTDKSYLSQYRKINQAWEIIYNYSSLTFIDDNKGRQQSNKYFPEFLYCGVISLERSLDTLIGALNLFKTIHDQFHVHLFGKISLGQKQLESIAGYHQVAHHLTFYGYTDYKIVLKNAPQSVAGIALLKPVGDYVDAYPTKLFEYMSLKLPVITSHFALYKDVVESERCGYCIDPYDKSRLAEVLLHLVANPINAQKMGQNGRAAIIKKYNWHTEEAKLFSFYTKVLNR